MTLPKVPVAPDDDRDSVAERVRPRYSRSPRERSAYLLTVDEAGYLQRRVRTRPINNPWRQAISETVWVLRGLLGERLHSVYVRGSVSSGRPVFGLSDIDLVVVSLSSEPIAGETIRKLLSSVEAKYPFCAGLDVAAAVAYDDLLTAKSDSDFRWVLKLQGLCVFGDDVTPLLPDVQIGPHMFVNTRRVRSHLSSFLRTALANPEPPKFVSSCRSIMKALVRAAFELVMDRVQAYTTDLALCCEIFSAFHPDQAHQVRRAVGLALSSNPDRRQAYILAKDFGTWLLEVHFG